MEGNGFIQIHVANAGAGTAVLRVDSERCRSGVFHVRSRDDAQHLALGAGEIVPHVLHAGIVPLVTGIIREDSFLTVVGFVTSRVASCSGGGVRDDGVERGSVQDRGHWKGIHGQRIDGFALSDAFGNDAGSGAVGQAHPIPDQVDNIFGFTAQHVGAHDLEIARCGGYPRVTLEREDGEVVHAGIEIRIGTDRHAVFPTANIGQGHRAGDGNAIDREEPK